MTSYKSIPNNFLTRIFRLKHVLILILVSGLTYLAYREMTQQNNEALYAKYWTKRIETLNRENLGCGVQLQNSFAGGTGLGREFSETVMLEKFRRDLLSDQCATAIESYPRAKTHHKVTFFN